MNKLFGFILCAAMLLSSTYAVASVAAVARAIAGGSTRGASYASTSIKASSYSIRSHALSDSVRASGVGVGAFAAVEPISNASYYNLPAESMLLGYYDTRRKKLEAGAWLFDLFQKTTEKDVLSYLARQGIHGVDAKDLSQEVFLRIYRRVSGKSAWNPSRAPLRAWLKVTTDSTAKDYLIEMAKNYGTYDHLPYDVSEEDDFDWEATRDFEWMVASHEIESDLFHHDSLDCVDRVLADADDPDRDIVKKVVKGHTYKELGARHSFSENKVMKRFQKWQRKIVESCYDDSLLAAR